MTVAFVLVPAMDSLSLRDEITLAERITPVFYHELTAWHTERCIVAPIDHYLSLGVFDFPCPVMCYGDISLLPLAFRTGCKDYLKNPWTPSEAVCRLSNLLDTHYPESRNQVEMNFMLQDRTLSGPACPIELTEHEGIALRLFLEYPSTTISRESLEKALDLHSQSRSLDMAISRLRKKFLEAGGTDTTCASIVTVRQEGYKLSPFCCVHTVDNLGNSHITKT